MVVLAEGAVAGAGLEQGVETEGIIMTRETAQIRIFKEVRHIQGRENKKRN